MILVILVACIIAFIVGVCLMCNWRSNHETLGGALMCVSVVLGVVSLIAMIVLSVGVSNLTTIDERIAMYQEENTKIEMQIAEVVQQYQKYETDIIAEVTPESSMTLVTLYPDLKSDTLVSEQMKVYTENNAKIKSLREEKITGSVQRWWLYFGN